MSLIFPFQHSLSPELFWHSERLGALRNGLNNKLTFAWSLITGGDILLIFAPAFPPLEHSIQNIFAVSSTPTADDSHLMIYVVNLSIVNITSFIGSSYCLQDLLITVSAAHGLLRLSLLELESTNYFRNLYANIYNSQISPWRHHVSSFSKQKQQ